MLTASQSKKINPQAYNALADALTVVFWNKTPFERYIRGMLDGCSEISSRLDFGQTKREVSGHLVNLLRANEHRYLNMTVALMLDVASMDHFPNLEEQVDAAEMIAKAKRAVAELRRWTERQQEVVAEQQANAAEILARAAKDHDDRRFTEAHESLKTRFLLLHGAGDPQQRGRDFEVFLNELFALYDLEPRLSYVMDHEQIDGAFLFNTDHYVVEAKWLKGPAGRPLLDEFKANVERKGKNTLGLYVSVNGFTSDAVTVYSFSTPFITMDGTDIMAVLEQRIRLDGLIAHKKAHASQTGRCHLPVAEIYDRGK